MSTVCEHCGRPGAVHVRPCCESPDGQIVGAEPGPEYVDQDRDTLSLTEENIERALSRMVATRTPQGLTDVKRKRVSRVYKISDYPAGTRRRGWGLLHDQIWFYDEPETVSDLVPLEVEPGGAYTGIYRAPDGKLWRIEWERLDPPDPTEPHVTHRRRWLRLYMDRRMLWLPRWLGNLRIRIHRFHSGDDDSAEHDHPWSFWTFPLATYTETTNGVVNVVRRLRLHYRRAEYQHFVHEPSRPFTTIVIARETYPPRVWGFWPKPDKFVPYTEWTEYDN